VDGHRRPSILSTKDPSPYRYLTITIHRPDKQYRVPRGAENPPGPIVSCEANVAVGRAIYFAKSWDCLSTRYTLIDFLNI